MAVRITDTELLFTKESMQTTKWMPSKICCRNFASAVYRSNIVHLIIDECYNVNVSKKMIFRFIEHPISYNSASMQKSLFDINQIKLVDKDILGVIELHYIDIQCTCLIIIYD